MSNELDLLLDEWKGLTAAATPGPWHWEPPSRAAWPIYDESLVTEDGEAVLRGWGYDASGIEGDPADRKFIALSRIIVPRLLAAVEAVLNEERAPGDDVWVWGYNVALDDVVYAMRAALIGDDDE